MTVEVLISIIGTNGLPWTVLFVSLIDRSCVASVVAHGFSPQTFIFFPFDTDFSVIFQFNCTPE